MPGSGFLLLQSDPADIETPPAGKIHVFHNSLTGEMNWKDSAGAVHTFVGTPGTPGAAGPAGAPGPIAPILWPEDRDDAGMGMPGSAGPQGAPGAASVVPGPMGPPGVFGEDGEDGLRGPPGQSGVSVGGASVVVQIKTFETSAVANGATLTPYDDTIPQNTEGDEYMTLAITPTNAGNKLRIDVISVVSPNLNSELATVALFQDSGVNALAAVGELLTNTSAVQTIPLTHYITAGTTSSTTFRVRIGVNAGSITFNGSATATRRYGGVAASSITITEFVP